MSRFLVHFQKLLTHILTMGLTQIHGQSPAELELNGVYPNFLSAEEEAKKKKKRKASAPCSSGNFPNVFFRLCSHLSHSALNSPGRSPCSSSSRVHLLLEKFSTGPSWAHSSIRALDEYLPHVSHRAVDPPRSKRLMINCSFEQWQFHGSLGTTTLHFHPLDNQAITGQ